MEECILFRNMEQYVQRTNAQDDECLRKVVAELCQEGYARIADRVAQEQASIKEQPQQLEEENKSTYEQTQQLAPLTHSTQPIKNRQSEQSPLISLSSSQPFSRSPQKAVITLAMPTKQTHSIPQKSKTTLPIQFRRHKKIEVDKHRQKQNRDLNSSHVKEKSVSKETRGSRVYNPVTDRSLVQYFYPRQSKILKLEEEELSPIKKSQSNSPVKPDLKLCKTDRKFHIPKQYKPYHPKSYITINHPTRDITFTDYDLLSCQLSMSPCKMKKKSINNLGDKAQKRKIGEMVMLKKRMNVLEEKVMERLPYLIRMGVSFKKGK